MKSLNQRWIAAALVGVASLLTTAPSQAAEVILRAASTTATMPDGVVVPMWGLAEETTFGDIAGTVTVPGPAITLGQNDGTLRIVLDNRLAEGISLVIPGLAPPVVRRQNQNGPILAGQTRISLPSDVADGPNPARDRARSFVAETPPNNQFPDSGTTRVPVLYIWNNVPPGTYLYHSGSHVALQVQMGLYGALTKRAAAQEVYPGIRYNQNLDVTLLFSEVDADLHVAVDAGQYGPGLLVPSTIHSKPQYYLINGKAYDPVNPNLTSITLPARPTPTRPALLRLINAGQDARVPIIDRSELTLIAQDSRTNDYARTQYSVQLPPLKTVDALWTQLSPGTFALYDRALGLANKQQAPGGMLVPLQVP